MAVRRRAGTAPGRRIRSVRVSDHAAHVVVFSRASRCAVLTRLHAPLAVSGARGHARRPHLQIPRLAAAPLHEAASLAGHPLSARQRRARLRQSAAAEHRPRLRRWSATASDTKRSSFFRSADSGHEWYGEMESMAMAELEAAIREFHGDRAPRLSHRHFDGRRRHLVHGAAQSQVGGDRAGLRRGGARVRRSVPERSAARHRPHRRRARSVRDARAEIGRTPVWAFTARTMPCR